MPRVTRSQPNSAFAILSNISTTTQNQVLQLPTPINRRIYLHLTEIPHRSNLLESLP